MSCLDLHHVRPTPSLPEPPRLQQGASSLPRTSPPEPTAPHCVLPSRPALPALFPGTHPLTSQPHLSNLTDHSKLYATPALLMTSSTCFGCNLPNMWSVCCLYTHNRTLSAVPSIPLSKIPVSVCPPDRYCLRVGTVLFFSYVPPKSVPDWP